MQSHSLLALILPLGLALLAGCRPIQPVAPAADQAQPAAEMADPTTVLYQTGFEPPEFALEPLEGQGGWHQWIGQAGGATIASVTPATGSQALRNDGSLMTPVPDRPWSGVITYYNVNYNAVEHQTPVLMIEADVRLDGPSTDTGAGLQDDKVSANLVAWDVNAAGGQGLAFNQLSSSEKVLTSAGTSAPVTLGEYHRLGLRLDFTQQTAEYFVDGVSFGIEPFRDTQSAVGLGDVRLDLVGDPDIAAQYTASYDNLMIRVIATEAD
jgi:hypothetical protein